LSGDESELAASEQSKGSWAVSFGMPSMQPDVWRADIEMTRKHLPPAKLLSVSVVGTVQPDWSIDDLADDYAACARWAVDSGADCIETNFSCPNVATCDGQLFQQVDDAGVVVERVRQAVGSVPFIVKIGHVTEREPASKLLDRLGPHITALALTNSVATLVRGTDGRLMFDGQQRGICGDATRTASIAQTRLFSELINQKRLDTKLIGVGGASTAEHVEQYLQAGAEAVHIATAAMLDPSVGIHIRNALAETKKRPG
jgi:dihydroorotate dehydrogenase